MKKALSFLLAWMTLICLMITALPMTVFATETDPGTEDPGSEAVENVNLAIKSYSPTSMVSGGDVTLDIAITNSGSEIQNVKLKVGGSTVADYGTMAAGASENYKNAYNVSADKLDKDIEVELQYTFNGEQRSKKSSFKVAKKAASVSVSTAVKADSTEVASGSKVKLTFAIENKGNVKIENAKITASELNKGNPISSAFSVEAGDSKVITYTATINETTPIEPILTYTADGKTYTKNMETLTIQVNEVAMTVLASVSNAYPAADEEITFTISMNNSGNVDLQNLLLTASNGENVPLTSTRLPAEGTLEATFPITLEESGMISFTLTAEDENGEKYTYTSNMVDIVVQEKPAEDYTGKLSLVVTVDTSEYKKNNLLKFKLTIKNDSDSIFTDVKLTEDTIGELGLNTISMLYPGESSYDYNYQLEKELEQDTTYYFKMTAVDPDGYTVVVSANAIEVEVNGKKSNGLGALIWIIIIIVLLLIGGGITLLVLINKEKKAQEQERELQARRVMRRAVERTPVQRTAESAGTFEHISGKPDFEEQETEPEHRYQPSAEQLEIEQVGIREEQAEYPEIQPTQEEENKPELEEFPQRRREKPAMPKRVNKSSDFMDRNNF